jgi:hypothetical protein
LYRFVHFSLEISQRISFRFEFSKGINLIKEEGAGFWCQSAGLVAWCFGGRGIPMGVAKKCSIFPEGIPLGKCGTNDNE